MILSQQNNVDFAFQQGHFAPCATTPNQPTQQALIHHQFSFEDGKKSKKTFFFFS